MDHAKAGFMDNFAERFGVMVAKAQKCTPVPKAAEAPENAAEKQHSVTKQLYDALGNVVAECELPLGTPGKIALYADGEIIAEADEPDVPDINDGNIDETASEPEKEDDTPEPAEDTKAKTNELFMKLIKGEM